ncbi:hypothetical protein C8R44DRAFT_742253 [Mycena epipterygia]|nr:hypothetical protein C8R44DRAFT_742253 [Mycena epipterygia]
MEAAAIWVFKANRMGLMGAMKGPPYFGSGVCSLMARNSYHVLSYFGFLFLVRGPLGDLGCWLVQIAAKTAVERSRNRILDSANAALSTTYHVPNMWGTFLPPIAPVSAHEKWPLGLRRQRSGNGNPTTGAPRAQRYELIALGFMGIGGAVVELQSTQRHHSFTAYCSDVGNDGTGEHPEAKIPTLS